MAEAIREAIESKGHGAYTDLARQIGVTKDVLYNLAKGRTSVRAHEGTVEELRKLLEKPTGWPSALVSGPGYLVPEGYVEMPYVGKISAGASIH